MIIVEAIECRDRSGEGGELGVVERAEPGSEPVVQAGPAGLGPTPAVGAQLDLADTAVTRVGDPFDEIVILDSGDDLGDHGRRQALAAGQLPEAERSVAVDAAQHRELGGGERFDLLTQPTGQRADHGPEVACQRLDVGPVRPGRWHVAPYPWSFTEGKVRLVNRQPDLGGRYDDDEGVCGVRVERCFAFIDLCGFTSFVDQRGDAQAVLVLADLRRFLRVIAARRGVRIVKWLGDGAMLSATSTEAAVATVIEAQYRLDTAIPHLALRAGMDAGGVIMFEGDDYIGRPVNIASRLCDAAEPGQVLVTQRVSIGGPRWTERSSPTSVSLRGIHPPNLIESISLTPPGDDAALDPVCGLTVPGRAAVVDPAAPDGQRFCSVACLETARDEQPVALEQP